MADIPYPTPRLKWIASMIKDLLRVDDRWSGARLLNHIDPLKKTLVMFTPHSIEDAVWVPLKQILRAWSEQNDCVAKEIRRYQNRVEIDLLIKYQSRCCDFSPHKPLPKSEQRWRSSNLRE
jgi:hypothetical protein